MSKGFSESPQKPFEADGVVSFKPLASLKATLRLGPGGRVVIPADIREAMGLKQGDAMVVELHGKELRVATQMNLVREIQAILAQCVPEGVSLVDELIADRRAEVAKEALE